MNFSDLSNIPVIIIMGASLIVLISQDWRSFIIAIAIQYLGVFLLTATVWPLGLAAIKLIVGWIAGSVIGASQPNFHQQEDAFLGPSGSLFRVLAAGMMWLLVFSMAPILMDWFPAGLRIMWGGLILIGMGLLQLGISTYTMRVVVGLLTVLAGFEIIYAAVETSVLVAGLLALVNLGLALTGIYLLGSTRESES
jgi:hypothetical protein